MWRNPTRSRIWHAPDMRIGGVVLQVYETDYGVFKVDVYPRGQWISDSKKFHNVHDALAYHEKQRRRLAVKLAINNLVTV